MPGNIDHDDDDEYDDGGDDNYDDGIPAQKATTFFFVWQ